MRSRGAAHFSFKHTMKLRVTPEPSLESGVEHGVALASPVESQKFIQAQSIAKAHHADARLLFEEAAESGRTESGMPG